MDIYPIQTMYDCPRTLVLMGTTIFNAKQALLLTKILVDVLPVFQLDLGHHFLNADVCHFTFQFLIIYIIILATGRCSIPVLFTYLQTTSGVRATRQDSFIYTNGVNDDEALGGSNITVQCSSGYRHIGGSLTIICTESNSWTTFPNCTPISTTTTPPPPNRCTVTENTWSFPDGFLSNTRNLTVYDDDTAKGKGEI